MTQLKEYTRNDAADFIKFHNCIADFSDVIYIAGLHIK